MSFQKKNVLIWSVIVALLCGIAFLASSMFASAQEGETNANGDETTLEVQTDGDAELSATKIKMYRLYNKYTGEHFYTKDASEKANLVKIGWTDEGVGWIAPSTSKYPVYRLNNPFSADGDHHYTMDSKEKDSLVKAGWKYEGIGWYSLAKDDQGAIPLLRQYNKYASSGSHNYTTSTTEQANLVKAGWKAEGVGWYGYDKNSSLTEGGAIDFSKATVDTASKVYKAAQWQPSVSIPGLTKNTDYTVTYGANKNAGTGTITVKGKGKWTGSKTYSFKITQREITSVTWSASTWTYDGKTHAPTATAKGVLSVDVKNFKVNVSGSQKKAGTFTAKAASVSNSNYKLKQNFTKSCTINKKEVTVTGIKVQDKKWTGTYEATCLFDSVVITGKVGNDDLKVTGATGTFASLGPSNDPINVTISNIVLGGSAAGNYKLASKGNQTSATAKIFDKVTNAKVTFNTQGHGKANFEKDTAEGYVAEPTASDYGTATGLTLEGWYEDSACRTERVNFGAKSINEDTTLYANWVPASEATDYWIGPSMETITGSEKAVSNQNYAKAAWNVKKSSTEIQKDIETMKTEAGSGTVTSQYKSFMENDDYHLYVKWNGSTVDGSGSAQSYNEYLEFRIIEVGSHDGDSSTLTFQSAYLLPESRAMKDDCTSAGGWAKSDLRSYLNGTGFTSLITSNLTSKIVAVPKVSTKGGTSTEVTDAVRDNFWIASLVEIIGTKDDGYVNEGKQYSYYSDKVADLDGKNPALIRLTRAGYNSANGDGTLSSWWTRSPYISQDEKYCRLLGGEDRLVRNMYADLYYGVVPCFCL